MDHAKFAAPASTVAMLLASPAIAPCPHGQDRRHATPIDARGTPYGDGKLTDKTNRLSYPFGVMVNIHGDRRREDLAYPTRKRRVILNQPCNVAFQLRLKVTGLLGPGTGRRRWLPTLRGLVEQPDRSGGCHEVLDAITALPLARSIPRCAMACARRAPPKSNWAQPSTWRRSWRTR
jgi:hypothetical protein